MSRKEVCQRKDCGKTYVPNKIGNKRLFCSKKCQEIDYYQKNKETYIENSTKWQKANPERNKVIREKMLKKYFKNNREQFNKLMRKVYHNNKFKWSSRSVVGKIINGTGYKQKKIPNPNCKHCDSQVDLTIWNDTYPHSKKEVYDAIDKGLIYYICKECKKKNDKI